MSRLAYTALAFVAALQAQPPVAPSSPIAVAMSSGCPNQYVIGNPGFGFGCAEPPLVEYTDYPYPLPDGRWELFPSFDFISFTVVFSVSICDTLCSLSTSGLGVPAGSFTVTYDPLGHLYFTPSSAWNAMLGQVMVQWVLPGL
jgi:hypothetical protein